MITLLWGLNNVCAAISIQPNTNINNDYYCYYYYHTNSQETQGPLALQSGNEMHSEVFPITCLESRKIFKIYSLIQPFTISTILNLPP